MNSLAPPSPRHLLMNLLRAADSGCLTAAEAVAAGELFGISGNATRVALARLAAAGLVDATTRGTYRLGQAGIALDKEVSSWRDAEQRVVDVERPMDRGADRGPAADRSRGVARTGARAVAAGVARTRSRSVRPSGQSRRRRRIGALAPRRARRRRRRRRCSAPISSIAKREQQARKLWDVDELTRRYRDGSEQLEKWLKRSRRLSEAWRPRNPSCSAIDAIRQLVFDPLLPEPLIDVALRCQLPERRDRIRSGRPPRSGPIFSLLREGETWRTPIELLDRAAPHSDARNERKSRDQPGPILNKRLLSQFLRSEPRS